MLKNIFETVQVKAAEQIPIGALPNPKDSGVAGGPNESLGTYISQILNYGLGLIGLVLFIIILQAGFKYLLARENASETKESLTAITNATIGLIILFASWLISQYVLTAVIPK